MLAGNGSVLSGKSQSSRDRKRVQRTGALESLWFELLFPLAGFRGTGQDKVREAQFAPECGAM